MSEKVERLEPDRAGGVILNPPRKQAPQSIYWCFTLNNYEVEQIERLEHTLKVECDWYLFQEETGENGTEHLQGTLKLKKRARLSELKHFDQKIHWEPTKCVNASKVYCMKADTRTGKIYAHNVAIPVVEEVRVSEPKGWQTQVMDLLKEEPDDRTIHWFWEPNGRMGKSTLCKYLVVRKNAILLHGKAADMYHGLSKHKTSNIKLIVIDVPRCSLEYINYAAIENIKNGLIFSGKYEGCQMVFNCPHVVVFANEPPRLEAMSADRWHVVRIDNNALP